MFSKNLSKVETWENMTLTLQCWQRISFFLKLCKISYANMATELLLASSFCLGSSLCVFLAVFVTKHSVTDTFCASSKATAPIRKKKSLNKCQSRDKKSRPQVTLCSLDHILTFYTILVYGWKFFSRSIKKTILIKLEEGRSWVAASSAKKYRQHKSAEACSSSNGHLKLASKVSQSSPTPILTWSALKEK